MFRRYTPLALLCCWGQGPSERTSRVTLDFNDVDLSVFVRSIGELTGKNFVLDERVTGKITIFFRQ